MADALAETCAVFAAACNHILAIAAPAGVSNNIQLHHLVYKKVRTTFPLTANLAVRAARRVSEAMTAAKRRKRQPQEFRPTSVDYDARIFDYREAEETVSLSTVQGRLRIPLRLGGYQRKALAGKKPTAATLLHRSRGWFLNIVVEDEDSPSPGTGTMGSDLGIRNTAATNFGTLHNGASRQRYKADRQRVRSSLQSKNTQGAKSVLRRISGKERRYIKHENHVLSRSLVDEAVRHGCGTLRLERLTHIRKRTKIWSKHFNRMMAGWSFQELQQFVEYKATRAGIKVEYIDPAYTSQTCATCGALGKRKQDLFTCTTCGNVAHADINAARNMAAGGVVVNRPESELVGASHHPPSESPRL